MAEWIEEESKQTAMKIRVALKKQFPDGRIKVKPGVNRVLVEWMDGPLTSDVTAVLSAFSSYLFHEGEEQGVPIGYVWEGQRYLGPEHISTLRTLTEGRKKVIDGKLKEWGLSFSTTVALRIEEAEVELIEAGKLSRHAPKEVIPWFPSSRDGTSTFDQSTAKVIEFPGMEAIRMVDAFWQDLTLEQKMKVYCLQKVFGEDVLTILFHQESNVDALFLKLARNLFKE